MSDPIIPHPPTPPIPVSEDRIWIDGCFDFAHHGHANAILQAKLLGKYLVAGVHSDEDILENKGPTVMTLPERILAVQACKWANLVVPDAPYVTSPEWLDLYGTKYVVHGDDITTDADGNDCYQTVKDMGRFKVVKRTKGISTTDLVGRMLLCTRQHHIKTGEPWDEEQLEHLKAFASDEWGIKGVGSQVWQWTEGKGASQIIDGKGPEGRKVVYVDGGFDLFGSGHIQFLQLVVEKEIAEAAKRGEFEGADESKGGRKPFVVAGVHDDKTINHFKGLNYPIMNMFERGLCVLQCRYISQVVFGAPFAPPLDFLTALPNPPSSVYHGPTAFLTYVEGDPYKDVREAGLFEQIGSHEWMGVSAPQIVQRIIHQRDLFEERQRKKAAKAEKEVEMERIEKGLA